MMASGRGQQQHHGYLTTGLPVADRNRDRQRDRSIENVSDCTFIPKDDALANMMESLGDDGTILQGLEATTTFCRTLTQFRCMI